MIDNEDFKYDSMVDRIICSYGFETCPYKTDTNDCKLYYEKEKIWRRCWHIKSCPAHRDRTHQKIDLIMSGKLKTETENQENSKKEVA